MSELPKDWIMSTVGEVAKCITGNTPPKDRPDYYGDLIPFVKPTQLDDKTVSDAPEKLSDQGAKVARVLDANSVLVSCIGNLGKTALSGRKVAFNQQINAAVFHAGVEPKYGFYFFQSSLARHQLENLSSATTITIVNKSKFQSVKIPIAPLPEQRRIVARIEELFSRLDAGVAALRHAKAQLQRYRQSVLAAAVTGQLTQAWREQHLDTELTAASVSVKGVGGMSGVLDQWNFAKISEFAKTTSGGTPSRKKPEFYTGVIPWIKSGDLNDGMVSEATEFITEDALKNSSAKMFPAGTLMIALYGATIGKLGVLTINAATNQAVCGIFVPGDVETKYLFYFLLQQRRELVEQGAGGAQPNISQAIIRDVKVPLPPLPEQRQIVAEVEARTTAIDHLEAELDRQITRSNRLRQSTLRSAFLGQL